MENGNDSIMDEVREKGESVQKVIHITEFINGITACTYQNNKNRVV
jgi:hypothetical protein